MTQVVNHNEQVRRAAEYIQIARAEHGTSLTSLLDEAGMRFNLTPLDAMALERLFRVQPDTMLPKVGQPAQTLPDVPNDAGNAEHASNASAGSGDAPVRAARSAPYVPACARGRGGIV